MTLDQVRTSIGRRPAPPVNNLRLRLKPNVSQSGYVDGAWWPRGDDLVTELPDLLAVLSVRLGAINYVTYNLDEWAKAPAKLATGGRAVRLDGDRLHAPNTLEVLAVDRSKIELLVVPWHTDPDYAHATVMAAAAPSNASTVDGLLMISEQDRENRTRATAAQLRWESEG